jgi:recombination protein RecT
MAYALNNAQTSKPKFSVAIQSDAYKKLINNTLGDADTAKKFVAEITTVVSQNPTLSNCDAGSIVSAGLLAQTINLSLAPSLGFAYIVPYKDKATFQIGYKGLIQLAIRSGQFERLGVRPVHEGEYAGQDEFGDDKFTFSHEFDANKTIGYYAYFVLVNGFKKTLYMTLEQVLAHAKQYSKNFAKYGTGLWADQFDLMAEKTVLKLLLNRYAPMSTEMHRAIKADQAVVKGDDTFEYVDNADAKDEPKAEEAKDEELEPADEDDAS